MGGVSGLVGGEGGGEDMIANHWMFDEAEDEAEAEEAASRALPRSHSPSPDPTSDEGHEMDLDNLRDGSISRRPAWRRPSPKWIYPFIIGATLSMGMGMAPRSELFISLACLAHPPQQPSRYDMTLASMVSDIWKGDPGFSIGQDSITINATRPMEPIPRVPISASDEWFYKLQREIYEYKLSHHQIQSSPSSPALSTSHVLPSAPLPYPTSPADDPMPPTDPPPVEEEPKPDPGREADKVPYHEIDPAQCKKDPKVQAAAAQLTMSQSLPVGIRDKLIS